MEIHEIVFTETANECLLTMAEYIALDNPERAETFIEEIVESLFTTLSIFPLSGKVYEGMGGGESRYEVSLTKIM